MRFSHVVILSLCILFIFAMYSFFVPIKLDKVVVVEIPYGSSITTSSDILKNQNIIRSRDSYMLLLKIFHPRGIVAGRYAFSGNVSLTSVVYRLSIGDFQRKQIKLTIPEGFTNTEVVNRISALFPNIPKIEIQNNLLGKEGYIYPETYFFDPDSNIQEIISNLITKSDLKLSSILDPITIDSEEAKRILIIASLVEAEGKNETERHMIAGIIENRLAANMPLQLDATLTYITGRGSSELTQTDLKNPSPYNTYIHTGLPPAPINNPGEESIKAAMDPTKSNYLFYLHAKNEQIYYAKTYAEHLKNKNKYLR